MKASPSLSVSLAARPNDNFSLVFHTRDSVTFSTSRHKFDINRIAVLATQRNAFVSLHHVFYDSQYKAV